MYLQKTRTIKIYIPLLLLYLENKQQESSTIDSVLISEDFLNLCVSSAPNPRHRTRMRSESRSLYI